MFPRKLCLSIFALLVCLASVAVAGETVFRITKPGFYRVAGSQIVTYDLTILDVGGPVVPPIDPPVVPPVNNFEAAVVAEVNKIPVSDKRHESALKLTATYQMLAGQVKDGKIHPANAVAAADLICPIALGAGSKDTWGGVWSLVNAAVAKAGTPAECVAVFDAAATAVLSTVPASGDLEAAATRYGFDWNAFLAFLMQLLQILLPLIIT